MADWRKLAKALALADGYIDTKEPKSSRPNFSLMGSSTEAKSSGYSTCARVRASLFWHSTNSSLLR